jgi:hypothetical protein
MLNKTSNLRVCKLNDFKNFKFFQNFNWCDLFNKKIRPPYKPTLRDYRHNLESCDMMFEELINVSDYLTLV